MRRSLSRLSRNWLKSRLGIRIMCSWGILSSIRLIRSFLGEMLSQQTLIIILAPKYYDIKLKNYQTQRIYILSFYIIFIFIHFISFLSLFILLFLFHNIEINDSLYRSILRCSAQITKCAHVLRLNCYTYLMNLSMRSLWASNYLKQHLAITTLNACINGR